MARENVRTGLAKGQYMEFLKPQADPMAPDGLPEEHCTIRARSLAEMLAASIFEKEIKSGTTPE